VNKDISKYNDDMTSDDKAICDLLATMIDNVLEEAESKVWHAHPVWFLEGNPIVGYNKQKTGIRLMFWSGMDFEEVDLNIHGKKFKDASIVYRRVEDIDTMAVQRWLTKSRGIQWDYKNIVKRKGNLERLL